VLEWNVEESCPRLGEDVPVRAVAKVGVDVDAAAAAAAEPRDEFELAVDPHRLPIADEDPGGYRRKPVPRGEETAGLVERGGDEPAVHEPRTGLVARPEGEGRFIPLRTFALGARETDALRIVAAAPAGGVVVRRDDGYRKPPRSKCAR
jgi:hypothetical protein